MWIFMTYSFKSVPEQKFSQEPLNGKPELQVLPKKLLFTYCDLCRKKTSALPEIDRTYPIM